MNLNNSWSGSLSIILEVAQNGDTAKGRRVATDHLRQMAQLADAFGQELVMEVIPMDGDKIAMSKKDVNYYDILIRQPGEDPVVEIEDLTEEEAEQMVRSLHWKHPAIPVDDLRELLV